MLKTHFKEGVIEAGCDEAGRGCLAGPVFAAAVILPHDFFHPWLNDSKKLTEEKRNILRTVIEEQAIDFAVGICDINEIAKLNILHASIEAMHKALRKLKIVPAHVLVDGNRFKKFKKIEHTCIIGGDGIFASIAAASILAKTYRDEHMQKLHKAFPQYGWNKNKAYATSYHRNAIRQYGVSPHHRLGFRLLPEQLKLKF